MLLGLGARRREHRLQNQRDPGLNEISPLAALCGVDLFLPACTSSPIGPGSPVTRLRVAGTMGRSGAARGPHSLSGWWLAHEEWEGAGSRRVCSGGTVMGCV